MKAAILNRILLVLGFLGLYVAGVLSLAKRMGASLACGPGGGCDKVNSHPSSYWLGIPVAYYGVAAYLLFITLATIIFLQGPHRARKVVYLGYGISLIGAITSIGLQVFSRIAIGVFCTYCLASAGIMVATLLAYALLAQRVSDAPEVVAVEASASDSSRRVPPVAWPAALAVVVAFSLGVHYLELQRAATLVEVVPAERLNTVQLIPDPANSFGPDSAPIKIIEFADLCCPSCQMTSPQVKDFARQKDGKVQVIFRHFPLAQHENAGVAAAIAEYAAEKGKFWDFTLGVMAYRKQDISTDEILQVARDLGLDVADIERRLNNDKDPIYDRLLRDRNAANALGLAQTPTFYVILPSGETRAYSAKSLFDALGTDEFKKILNGA